MSEKYDAIVIGSGCGGAAAAALAGYHGLNTLLVERNKFIGGRAATIERKGFKMDHGHIIARCNKGAHGEVLRIVKCADLMPEYAPVNNMPFSLNIFGKKWQFLNGKNRIDSKGGLPQIPIKKGLLDIARFIKARYLTLLDIPDIVRLILTLGFMSQEKMKELDHVDVDTFLSDYTDNELIRSFVGALAAVSFGVLPFETSAGELIRTYRIISKDDSTGYPITGEGVAAIPGSFLKAAKRYGVDIRTKTPVDNIVVENGDVKGVNIRGELVSSKIVISNAGIKETSFKLVGKEHFEKAYVTYLNNLRYSYGGFSLKYALDKPIIDFHFAHKISSNFDHNMKDALTGRLPEEACMMLVCTSNIDPSLAPKGKQILLVISPGPAVEPGKINWEPWIRSLKRQIEEDFVPGISKHTIFCDVSTPDVIARQNGRFFGDAIGVAQATSQVGENTPSAFSPIKGLYHVGADVGSKGIATEMATESAIDLFRDLKRKHII
ncbi:MAG: NAD(P)/FAD-dependent oxidoreductase [Desulfobacterales bacterium]|nr:NAD(P)/FAD-dependent oxidoreductase [Desulfobacterales bacterium]